MAKARRGRPILLILAVPAVLVAGLFAWVADNHFAAGLTGAIVGLFIGIALLAFPNLDRGGPSDTDSMLQ